MALFRYFFLFQGQIGRAQWWLARLCWFIFMMAVVVAITVPAVLNASGKEPHFPFLIQVLLTVIYWVMAFSLNMRRFRDRGKDGIWALVMWVPVIGPLWVLIECGFIAGKPGTNDQDLVKRFD